jgi:hypothetical protein
MIDKVFRIAKVEGRQQRIILRGVSVKAAHSVHVIRSRDELRSYQLPAHPSASPLEFLALGSVGVRYEFGHNANPPPRWYCSGQMLFAQMSNILAASD